MIPGAAPCPECGTAEKVEYVGMSFPGVACTDERHDQVIHVWGFTEAEALADWNRYANEHAEETTP